MSAAAAWRRPGADARSRLPGAPRTRWCTVGGDGSLRYALHVPPAPSRGALVLVSVHGISRNALAHARLLGRRAAPHGAVVVAPLFDRQRFPGYQRLGRHDADAVDALHRVLDDVHLRTGAETGRFALFGYSGGAQFAHRYALFRPHRVSRLGLGAAGWYTLPDMGHAYPRGLQGARDPAGVAPALQDFLSLPIRVFVGDDDGSRDEDLNRSPRIDRCQGATRVERARSFVNAVRLAALRVGREADVRLRLLPGGTHGFEQNVARAALDRDVVRLLVAPEGR